MTDASDDGVYGRELGRFNCARCGEVNVRVQTPERVTVQTDAPDNCDGCGRQQEARTPTPAGGYLIKTVRATRYRGPRFRGE